MRPRDEYRIIGQVGLNLFFVWNRGSGVIRIDIDPVLFGFGPFSLEWHGVLSALGILVAVVVAAREMHRRGFDAAHIYGVAWWAIIGGILGARLFHVIDYADYYLARPWEILFIMRGGLAIYGALFGGFAGAAIYAWRNGLRIGRFFDAGAPTTLLGLAIGRLGCLINGDAWGAPTGGDWGLVYIHPEARMPASLLGVPTHPFPVYELVLDLAIFAAIWRLRDTLKVEGSPTLLAMLGYAIVRFFLTFLRQEQVIFLGMQQAQLIAVASVAILGPWLLYLFLRQPKQRMEAPATTSADAVETTVGSE